MSKFLAGITILGLIWAVSTAKADDLSVFQKQAISPVIQLARNCSGTVINVGDATKTYILTANHCISDGAAKYGDQKGFITIDTKNRATLIETNQYVYDVLVRDTAVDLAVIKLRKEGLFLNAAKIGKEDPREGEKVWAIGYPLGRTKTVTEGYMGEYEALNKDLSDDPLGGEDSSRTMYRATPAIYGGNSGGALFHKVGDDYELIGVADANFRQFFVASFYVPQDEINKIVTRALKSDEDKTKKIEQKKQND